MRYEGNVAYDLSRFEKKKVTRLPVKKKKEKQRPKFLSYISTVLCVVVAVTITAMMMLSRVELNEMTTKISKANKQLNQLKNENVRLTLQAESKISLNAVEAYATNVLGMKKLQRYQIEYINLTDSDRVEVAMADDDKKE